MAGEGIVRQDDPIAFARDALGLPQETEIDCAPLGTRGSDRAYFRLRWKTDQTAILVRYDRGRVENGYFAEIAAFLAEIGVSVPRVICHDPAACLLVLEDLGAVDLWSLRGASWDVRGPLYRKTLALAHRLHSHPADRFPAARVRLADAFGPDLYRWERTYFKNNFVERLCGITIDPSFAIDLEDELAGLAQRIRASGRSLVHRDLQSQNVMIRDGEPFLIDFQGMRFGSPFYDLASLLCDPYVEFTEDEEGGLLSFYYGLAKKEEDWAEFVRRFREASIQRLMQALGAYGFLGLEKGLKEYLDHVPAAVRNLRRAVDRVAGCRRLQELLARCEPVSKALSRPSAGEP